MSNVRYMIFLFDLECACTKIKKWKNRFFSYVKYFITWMIIAFATYIKLCNNPNISVACVTIVAIVQNVFAVCILLFGKSLRK